MEITGRGTKRFTIRVINIRCCNDPLNLSKDFRCVRIILSGIEIAHMIRKGPMCDDGVASIAAEKFYSLVM